jgi:hypothetical protein
MDISKLSVKELRALQKAGVLNEMLSGERGGSKDVTTPPYIRPVYDSTWNQPNDGGIFTPPGYRPQTYSALLQPLGLTQVLNPEASIWAQERISILTGQKETVGTNPDDYCGAPVTPGDLKTCGQYFNWGMVHIGSQKININSAGEIANRAVNERVIMNAAVTDPLIPDLLQNPQANLMSLEAQAMYQVGTALRRALAPVMFTGNPATPAASATQGFIKEFTGLDRLIVDNHVDAETGVACPAADSTIINWNAAIDGTVGGQNITQQITAFTYGRWFIADEVGMSGATWAFVMNPDLFYALTAVYACQYATYRCFSNNAGQPITQAAPDVNSLRLQMVNGSYLLVEGRVVPVIQDNTIPITAGGGNYRKSDIYFMPLSWNGRNLLRLEFFPMDNQYQNELAGHFNGQSYTSNNGMYRIYWDRSMSCAQMVLDAKMRLILDAPFLAGRIQNLLYVSNIAGYRSPLPGTTGYVNGGAVSYNVNV